MNHFNQTVKIFSVLLGVLMVGVLLGVFLADIGYVPVGRDFASSAALSSEQIEDIRVDLTIDYGNGDTQVFPQEVLRSGETVLDLLENLERSQGITLQKRDFPGLGVFIEAIHGAHNTNSSYWQFWVNEEYAQVGASQFKLQDSDKVLWKRTVELPKQKL